MSAAMTAGLVTDALAMAISRRGRPRELLHHSDRGSQYTSEAFQRLMAEHGVTCSLSRSDNDLGQRGDGELLLLAQGGACGPQDLPHEGAGHSQRVRLHREVL